MDVQESKAPAHIQAKFDTVNRQIEAILEKGNRELTTELDGQIQLKYEISAPNVALTDFERAQSVCFVTKFESLPPSSAVNIVERKGAFYPSNIGYIRHVLNEYRPIVQNQDDSVHFQKIHSWCHLKLGADPKKGLSITVKHESGKDVTAEFKASLGERNRAIRKIIGECEFDYIYNGILQHSDHRFTTRFWEEYVSGELNYVFIKHATILEEIKDLLSWHYRLLNVLTFPKLGPL